MMEEVAPSDNLFAGSVSQAAPEAIAHKPRSRVEILPEAERTSEDRNRFRNASKRTRRTQRLRETAVGAAAATALENGSLQNRGRSAENDKLQSLARAHSNKRLLETLKNDKRVVLSSDQDNGHDVKKTKHTSSADFFSRLQESMHAPAGAADKRKRKQGSSGVDTQDVSSRRVKL